MRLVTVLVGNVNIDVVLDAIGHTTRFPGLQSQNVSSAGSIFYR